MKKKRDYTYDKAYNKKTVEQRSQRNKARRIIFNELTEKHGKTKAKQIMKGKDVDHKKPIKKGGKNILSNLRLLSPSVNRAKKP